MVNVGEKIKQRRKELNISADQLAEELGVNRATIYRYERGEIKKVSTDVLLEIADILKISPIELLGISDFNTIQANNNSGTMTIRDSNNKITNIADSTQQKSDTQAELLIVARDILSELQELNQKIK